MLFIYEEEFIVHTVIYQLSPLRLSLNQYSSSHQRKHALWVTMVMRVVFTSDATKLRLRKDTEVCVCFCFS